MQTLLLVDDEPNVLYTLELTLEELTLNSAKVTDASIEHLAGLKYLRKLNLGGTIVTASGKKKLAEQLPKAKIE